MSGECYVLDDTQLRIIQRVKSRLYDEMTRLTADDRRDLANTLDAVMHQIEQYGEVENLIQTKDAAVREAERLYARAEHAEALEQERDEMRALLADVQTWFGETWFASPEAVRPDDLCARIDAALE